MKTVPVAFDMIPLAFNTQDFADHAQLFGVQDAALMFRNKGFKLEWTLAYMHAAMRGMRVRFKAAEDGFDWLPVSVARGKG